MRAIASAQGVGAAGRALFCVAEPWICPLFFGVAALGRRPTQTLRARAEQAFGRMTRQSHLAQGQHDWFEEGCCLKLLFRVN